MLSRILQAEEVRIHAQANQKHDDLQLDEILAMCEEYEEQIAQEIEEKRTNAGSKLSVSTPYSSSLSLRTHPDHLPSSINTSGANSNGHLQSYVPKSNNDDNGNQNQRPNSPTTPTSAHHYNRYKQNKI